MRLPAYLVMMALNRAHSYNSCPCGAKSWPSVIHVASAVVPAPDEEACARMPVAAAAGVVILALVLLIGGHVYFAGRAAISERPFPA